ncbi:MAG: FliH/SctL family protein [Simkaniaceae bacterium]|nr:FliH/SctL family protein [Simkaniaceae bacterium]
MSKLFSLIFSGDVHREGEAKIIPAEQYGTLLEAEEVLDKAKEEVRLYLERNEEECREAVKKGYEAGFQKGLTEFNRQILLYEGKVREVEHGMKKSILFLTLQVARKVVGRELELNPDTIVDIVRQTLKPVTQSHKISIYVNKKDKEALETHKGELKKGLEQVETFSIEERADVAPGGCIIETEAGIINASLENQWRALESALVTFMRRNPQTGQ